IAAGVAVHRSTHRTGDPRGELEAGDAVVAAAKDHFGEIRAALDVHGVAVELDRLAGIAYDQPTEAIVRDEQVAATAEQEYRQTDVVTGAQCGDQLGGGVSRKVVVGEPTDLERRVVTHRLLRQEPRAEHSAQAVFGGGERSRHGPRLAARSWDTGVPAGIVADRPVHVKTVI